MARPRRKLNLQCQFCPKRYTKREHLQIPPFLCTVCGRCFSRQDVLSRHARVHGSDDSQSRAPGVMSEPQRSSQIIEWPPPAERSSPTGLDPQSQTLAFFNEAPLNNTQLASVDISSNVLWPGSEELLQSIMSIDPAIWQQPLALAPSMLGITESPSTYSAPPSERSTIADNSRQAIQSLSGLVNDTVGRVTAPVSLSGLTTRFLDGSLHMFCEYILPIFPIFHRPTLVFQECSAPLLLNAIALGALFLGTSDAVNKADVLWRLAHTAVATSWHTMITSRRPYDTCCGVELVQTVLLSQIYAALSKNRTFRTTSQVFHGVGIHWASYCGMYDKLDPIELPQLDDSIEQKRQGWCQWAAQETMVRTLLSLYIVDGVVSQFSGNPTFARHPANPLRLPNDDAAFEATSVDLWIPLIHQHPHPETPFCKIYHQLFHKENVSWNDGLSSFGRKVILEGIRCLVSEGNRSNPPPVGFPSKRDLLFVLRRLRKDILQSKPQPHNITDRLTALLQWHTVCLDMVTNTARGTRRLCHLFGIEQGIFGGSQRDEKKIDPSYWVQSPQARIALLHATGVQEIAAQLPLGKAHDINIPGIVFAAATTYTAFTFAGIPKLALPKSIDWDATLTAQDDDSHASPRDKPINAKCTLNFIAGDLNTTGIFRDEYILRDLTYDLTAVRTLLRGLSLQWGVATEMEEVVSAWIDRCELSR
ncbi:hypothetical protein BDV59DRAFT_206732 [Aspergillus ambiguus]|uniref:uncharacterized protein n=1 Tax=Aspergillus ambiguus TaxID=176160 RepID=UPI003CCE094F